ncbi:MAG: ABC transporter transmembrane domain-containing protein, partial [Cohaesibacter sp.]|nr:ABC transporter transmembrane domain-containing protein [Cohaesibacter sp.]
MVNLFGLAGPIFMLEIYDRVIPSKSIPTLIALLLLVAAIYGFSSLFDALRTRILARVASLLDQFLCQRVFAVIIGASLRTRIEGDALKPAHELDQIRNFLSSPGPAALFDLPWMPIYLFICYLMHPMIGWLAIGSVLLLIFLTLMTDLFTRSRMQESSRHLAERNRFGESAHANSEVIAAMAMQEVTASRWLSAHTHYASQQRSAGDATSMLMSFSKNVRLMIQSGSLALGAYLVIIGDLTGGMIIAASILISRTLAPIEQVIANWRAMLAARQSWKHLQTVMQMFPQEQERTSLPPPCKSLALENVFVSPPASMHMMAVQNVNFRVNAGSVVGIIGPSASGKSSLVRAIASVWPLA